MPETKNRGTAAKSRSAPGAQTTDLVPADRAMYALRNVTATVGNHALIASSIMFARSEAEARIGEAAIVRALGWSNHAIDAPPLIHDVVEGSVGP